MKTIKMSLVAAMAATVATTGASASMLEEIISNPQLDIEIRPRYEFVDVDQNNLDKANALTVRTAIGVKMGLFGVDGLNAQLQGMDVSHFGLIHDYAPERSGYEKVADPSQSRMTQANISYTYEGFTGIVGRKMVVLDNARFIGNVGWRQMPQTYDLVAAIYNWEGLNLLGAYVTRVNKVVDAHLDTNSVLLHANYKFMPELDVTVYDYMISNFADHIGIRATGKFDLDAVKLNYEAEYAYQKDPTMDDDNEPLYNPDVTDDNDASYYRIGLYGNMSGFSAGIAYELLGAADGGPGNYKGLSFNTPLATLHKFNGWADKFLGTPQEGLEDLIFKLGYNFGEYGKITGFYHIFSGDDDIKSGTRSDDDLGSEFDVAYNYKITKDLGLLLKGAWYQEGGVPAREVYGLTDTTKYWVQLDYKFHSEM
ncbi:hypothetical protein [Hydrogenimonas urashimensis]|uniref:hypothetical protein n=1 Tax=Hydrogenimonas urashimensis TaxID=2740515 RepID=UPI0019161DCC|nr:hypothetical protein [Hydrogenimonas urashimensis]